MSLLNSVNNLTSAVAEKALQLSTVSKFAACLPTILTSLPSIVGGVIGNVAKSVVGGIAGGVSNLLSSPGGFLTGIINETVGRITNAVTGLLNTILNLQAQIASSIQRIKNLITFLEDEFNDTKKWLDNSENCKFAAAELVNCIAGNLLGQLSSIFNSKIGQGFDLSIGGVIDNIVDKIEEPGEKLNGWVNNTASQIDRATSRINAASLF